MQTIRGVGLIKIQLHCQVPIGIGKFRTVDWCEYDWNFKKNSWYQHPGHLSGLFIGLAWEVLGMMCKNEDLYTDTDNQYVIDLAPFAPPVRNCLIKFFLLLRHFKIGNGQE
jgi:hypothetical protein